MNTTTAGKPQIKHTDCAHAQTPYARRQCRNHRARRVPLLAPWSTVLTRT